MDVFSILNAMKAGNRLEVVGEITDNIGASVQKGTLVDIKGFNNEPIKGSLWLTPVGTGRTTIYNFDSEYNRGRSVHRNKWEDLKIV